MVRSWLELSDQAGPASERVFEAKQRLFGAEAPDVIFWRDNSGWCPYCSKIWLLLEVMEVPYEMKTVPLRGYMAQGETKDPEFLAMIPSGVVPALQFRGADGRFADAVPASNKQLFQILDDRLPERYPRGDPRVFEVACGRGGIVDRFEEARRAFEACAGAPCRTGDALGKGLHDACTSLEAALQASGGPFVNGEQLTVPDIQLLPLLERVEAIVPYFFGKRVLDKQVPFERARRMLETARARTVFGDIASDATTLGRTNVCYAPTGFRADVQVSGESDGTTASVAQQWFQAARADSQSRCDAAARVARNHSAIANFARRSVKGFRRLSTTLVGADAVSKIDSDALDCTLRVVVELLLAPEELSEEEFRSQAASAASLCCSTYDIEAAVAAADALDALALGIGVPRDMCEVSARALRSHIRVFSAALRET